MKIKEVVITKGFKVVKNYNSANVNITLVAELSEEDKYEDVIKELNVKIDNYLSKELNKEDL